MKPVPEPILAAMREHELWYSTLSPDKQGQQLYLDEVDLSGTDLSGFILSDAYLTEVNFDDCRLVGTDFYYGNLGCSTFRDADMQNCHLGKTNIS